MSFNARLKEATRGSDNFCRYIVTIVVTMKPARRLSSSIFPSHLRSFEEKGLPALSLNHDLMQSVGRLREYRRREQLYMQ